MSDPFNLLVMADYSQLELRLGAYLSGDEKMIEGFKSGEDFHTRTFKEMYGRAPIEDKEKKIDERKIAKSINFGIWYGQGASGLAAVLKCKKSEAQEKLDLYLNTFTKVREYQTKIEREVLEKGYVVSKSGRMRRLPEVNSNDEATRSHAIRQAVNFTIQELGSTMTEKSLIKIDKWITAERVGALLVLTVHDSIGSEVADVWIEPYINKVKYIMEKEVPKELGISGIPIVADFKIGLNWGEMEKYDDKFREVLWTLQTS